MPSFLRPTVTHPDAILSKYTIPKVSFSLSKIKTSDSLINLRTLSCGKCPVKIGLSESFFNLLSSVPSPIIVNSALFNLSQAKITLSIFLRFMRLAHVKILYLSFRTCRPD